MIKKTDLDYNEITQVIEDVRKYIPVHQHLLTGSVVFNGEGNDIDIVILSEYTSNPHLLLPIEYELCGAEAYDDIGRFVAIRNGDLGRFVAIRNGDYNLIICNEREYYLNWVVARNLCVALGKLYGTVPKATHIAVHKVVVDGYDAEDTVDAVEHLVGLESI